MFGRKSKLADFSAEIDAHLALEIDRLQEQGRSEEQARAAAHRAFGNVTKAQERFYELAVGSGGIISGKTSATGFACCANRRDSRRSLSSRSLLASVQTRPTFPFQ